MEPKCAKMSMLIPRHLVQRICVWFCVSMKLSGKETVAAVQKAFGCTAYSRSSIFGWHKSFTEGRQKLGDLLCLGAPQRARTCRCIRQCKIKVSENRNISVDELSRTLGISVGSTHRILRKDLNLKKKSAKLIPHRLTQEHCRKRREFCQDFLRRTRRSPGFLNWVVTTNEAWFYVIETRTKQENMQWVTPFENRPQVARRPRNAKKLMVIPFFDQKGLLHVEFYLNMTINQGIFKALLEDVWNNFCVRRGNFMWSNRHRYLLHMDNVPAHRGDTVQRRLEELEW